MNYGLIGETLGHSFSPLIHRQLAGYEYELHPLPPKELDAFLLARDFWGINVTIPYKQAVIPYCDMLSETARRIGSVNTIVKRPDGSLFGDNTDLYGFLTMARRVGISLKGKKVVILGSGGTSLTVQEACRQENANEVIVVSRHGKTTYKDLPLHRDAQILINTTPVGMYPHCGKALCSCNDFPRLEGVLDVVYNPLRTAFLLDADAHAIPCSGGLPMLVAQAKRAAELFLDRALPNQSIDQILETLVLRQTNIVLIGMPGCGKSTIGALLAERLHRPFIDIDRYIAESVGKSIPQIFAEDGEEAFRLIERQMIAKYGMETGIILATGGGAVCDPRNHPSLMQNGWVIHLRRPLEQLATDGRPLSLNPNALQALWAQRGPLYQQLSDFRIENTGTPEETVDMITEAFYEIACH